MVSGDAAKEYAAGFAAGIAMVFTGHPFDTIKVKLQAHNTKTQVKEYRNAFHCTRQIIRTEGVKGLYRGASSSFIGIALESSLFFGIYSQTKQLLQGESHSSKPQFQVIIPSAVFVGSIISLILCPVELVKCRMQVQGKDSALSSYIRYNGPLDCALKTIKNEGIKGMFRGGLTTFLRESIGNAVFFTTYETSRYYMHSKLNHAQNQPSKLLQDVGTGIITGGISGMAFWATVLPLDVAKTVIQTAPDAKSSRNPVQTLNSVLDQLWPEHFQQILLRSSPWNSLQRFLVSGATVLRDPIANFSLQALLCIHLLLKESTYISKKAPGFLLCPFFVFCRFLFVCIFVVDFVAILLIHIL